jgi:glucose-6-phosphate 1-dehydrogenase
MECGEDTGWTRVLVEKPFGDDLETARDLDALLGTLFNEEQIYRIDHYLAKEMLQAILNFRFTNNLFEREWDREAIESIDVILLESIDADKRGAFYDKVGAMRDVGQNHLLQMLALVTMERPLSNAADDIRDARAALIERCAPTPEVATSTFRRSTRFRCGGVRPDRTETYFGRTCADGPRAGAADGAAPMEAHERGQPPPRADVPEDARYTNRTFTLEPADQTRSCLRQETMSR